MFAAVTATQRNRCCSPRAAARSLAKHTALSLRRTLATAKPNDVLIVSAARTPIGSFRKSLASVSATELGAQALRAAIARSAFPPDAIQEVYMGNVLSANLGQAPARQAALAAGCPDTTEATTINKVCASGLKAVILASQSIQLGLADVAAAGGMESMSNAPYYVERGLTFGNQSLNDSIMRDGLTDAYMSVAMGNFAEDTATAYSITRAQQDDHAVASYARASTAWSTGGFSAEIAGVTVRTKKGDTVVATDDEYTNVVLDKIPKLRSAFREGGSVTPANSSTLNDGAAAVVVAARARVEGAGLAPLARVLGYADAATRPELFTIAPSLAIPRALERAGVAKDDVSLWEVNEAFSVVIRANEKILGLDPEKVNVKGGAVALGHPIGASGARILVTLIHALKAGEIGVAAICNGGGAASAIVVERL